MCLLRLVYAFNRRSMRHAQGVALGIQRQYNMTSHPESELTEHAPRLHNDRPDSNIVSRMLGIESTVDLYCVVWPKTSSGTTSSISSFISI